MPDTELAQSAAQNDFLDSMSQQLAKDIGLLLGRRGQVQRTESPCSESPSAWMVAVFELVKDGKPAGQLNLFLSRKHAVRLAADMVRAPGVEAMAAAGDISDMVSDGLHEVANVCGAALARAFKAPLGAVGTCRMLDAKWGDEKNGNMGSDWSARTDILFTGLKEPFSFFLSLSDAAA
jgi:hypothetical protein